MGQKTSIEWTEATWNPVRGCTRITPGCGGGGSYSGDPTQRGGCYAEGIAARFSGPGQPFHGFAEMTEHGPRWTGKVVLVREKLAEPLRRKKPTTWFLSMFDPFHERLANEEIAALFGVMAACPQHTFQVLTKRAERMAEWFAWLDREARPTPHGVLHVAVAPLIEPFGREDVSGMDESDRAMERLLDADWPLPNVWLGASIESRKFKGRIDHLRSVPAAVRFLSMEPLLEDLGDLNLTGIHQVIAGSESGPGARPMHDDWVRSIRDQAKAQGCAFFLKQKLDARGRKVSLPMLDGQTWAEMPARTVTT